MRFASIRGALVVAGAVALGGAALSVQSPARADSFGFSTATVGSFGGEPYISSDSNGVLYDTSPSGAKTFRSLDHGATWSAIASPDNTSGDDCINEDQSNAAYWCNLAGTPGTAPLQATVWKSTVANNPAICTSANNSCQWQLGQGTLGNCKTSPSSTGCFDTTSDCATSCSPAGVDRMWTAASIPTNGTTATAEVVLMYHDFYGPSQIWVNISNDGGAHFNSPVPVLESPAVSINSATGNPEALFYQFCNTVPSSVNIVPNNLPAQDHPGRIYVAWIASDPVQDGSGCNVTMLQSFHTLWVSYSDDNGSTWTASQAIDMGIGHDASTPFTQFTLDDQGNPYFAWDSQSQSQNPAICSEEASTGVPTNLQNDPSCGYNMYVVWANAANQGTGALQWTGSNGTGNGTIPGSAGAPFQVNTDTGTDQFATIAVGDPGRVDVSWLHTSTIEPTDSFGKFDPGGCSGISPQGSAVPYPAACHWNLFAAQTTNLGSGTPTWQISQVTGLAGDTGANTPMHIGDICNLGIACVDPNSNRHMLDFNEETIDPTTGCAHIAYSDDNGVTPSPHNNQLVDANQTGGCDAFAALTASTPELPLPGLVIPAAAAVGLLTWCVRRRLTSRSAAR